MSRRDILARRFPSHCPSEVIYPRGGPRLSQHCENAVKYGRGARPRRDTYRGAPILAVPRKEAIPAIARAEFVRVAEASLLNHREIVNGGVDGAPLAGPW